VCSKKLKKQSGCHGVRHSFCVMCPINHFAVFISNTLFRASDFLVDEFKASQNLEMNTYK